MAKKRFLSPLPGKSPLDLTLYQQGAHLIFAPLQEMIARLLGDLPELEALDLFLVDPVSGPLLTMRDLLLLRGPRMQEDRDPFQGDQPFDLLLGGWGLHPLMGLDAVAEEDLRGLLAIVVQADLPLEDRGQIDLHLVGLDQIDLHLGDQELTDLPLEESARTALERGAVRADPTVEGFRGMVPGRENLPLGSRSTRNSPNRDEPIVKERRVIVLGGGAAGFFAAITCADADPTCQVIILERAPEVLAKVRISGGGRCNVTHACFDPARLVTFYPRGGRALRGPFSRFQPQDTLEWFESRGVALKTEEDGRIFPVTDQSETIINCLTAEAARVGVTVTRNVIVQRIERARDKNNHFQLILKSGDPITADCVIMATGSSPIAWSWAENLGHTLAPPVPSLFTFTISDPRLEDLAGLSVPAAGLSVEGVKLRQTGPLLITHTGLSGPAVLKLSAWGARELHERNYQFSLHVNWLGERFDPLVVRLAGLRKKHAANLILAHNIRELPRRLWARLCTAAGIADSSRWSDVANPTLRTLAFQITDGVFVVTGRSPFKEEFVTCGGVHLDQVDFRTMESKRCPGLYFAGEVLDIDGLTGGFNFQSAWTTGWIAGHEAAKHSSH